ncbi:MAG: AAA family ATPase [Victivallales bacterium]|nr:AAA family ATPase [Victivallales bacterium]
MEEIIDMHNRVNGFELKHLVSRNMEAIAERPETAGLIPPIMVWGAPGLGKSSILRQVAKDLGVGFIDVRLAQREPVDIRGLPVPGEDGVKWLVSSDWPRDMNSRGIILFDEITAADRSLQVAAYEFILDRRLGELYTVPNGWYICAAGNRTEDRAVATTISSALANRFMHLELGEDTESWLSWARRHDIRPEVMGFIRFSPQSLFRQKNENLERGWPSPRAWERVSRMLDILDGDDESFIRKTVYGLVGNRAGVEFMEFRKLSASFGDVKSMMTDPSAPVVIPERADMRYAIVTAMTYFLWRGRSKSEEAALIDGFYRLCMKLPSDFATMAMMDAIIGEEQENDKQKMEKLFQHKSFKEWSAKHGKELKKHIRL